MWSEKTTKVQVGGDIETSIRQPVPLSFKQLFSEGWRLGQKTQFVLLSAILGVGACIVLASMTFHSWGAQALNLQLTPERMLLVNLLLGMLFSPMTAALTMLGIRHSLGLTTKASQVFDYYRFLGALAGCTLLTTLLSEGVSLLLLHLGLPAIIPLLMSLYFMACFSFSAPLVIEKQLSPLRAMIVSFRVVNRQFTTVMGAYAALIVLLMVALVPFGLGLIWIAPLFFNVKGVLYRQLFGVRVTLAVSPTSEHFAA